MRGLVATLTLIVAIAGMVVVIAYAASDAYLTFRDREDDLNSTLLLGALAPVGWTAAAIQRAAFNEQFLSPCLGVPLLNDTGISGRGAMRYTPAGDGALGVQLLLLQTSSSNATNIMDSVRRDTENGCRRGIIVGTVTQADVTELSGTAADEGVLVTYRRPGDSASEHQIVAIVRHGGYIGQLSFRGSASGDVGEGEILALASGLADRIERPPSASDLEAAGVQLEPAFADRAAERLSADSTRVLSFDGSTSPFVGLGVFGAVVALLYVLGARLSRTQAFEPPPAQPVFGGVPLAPTPAKQPKRRWVRATPATAKVRKASVPETDIDAEKPDEYSEPSSPPPVLDFPQRSIEDKLRTLKDARLNEPRPEGPTTLPVTPSVDWTEEISKPQRSTAPRPADPQRETVSRKALLQKLRSQHPDA